MVNLGKADVKVLSDDWTVVTADGQGRPRISSTRFW